MSQTKKPKVSVNKTAVVRRAKDLSRLSLLRCLYILADNEPYLTVQDV